MKGLVKEKGTCSKCSGALHKGDPCFIEQVNPILENDRVKFPYYCASCWKQIIDGSNEPIVELLPLYIGLSAKSLKTMMVYLRDGEYYTKDNKPITFDRRLVGSGTISRKGYFGFANPTPEQERLLNHTPLSIVETDVNMANEHVRLGQKLMMSLRNEQALACFESAIALEPGNINAWNCKGLLFFLQGKIPEARDCYEKILTLNPGPEHAPAIENLRKTINLDWDDKNFSDKLYGIVGMPPLSQSSSRRSSKTKETPKKKASKKESEKDKEISLEQPLKWLDKALNYQASEKYQEAIECCEKVLEHGNSLVNCMSTSGNF